MIAIPDGPGPHPSVIYNHGMIVRIRGYEAARARGYDTAGYVQALADAGYVALAPIRDHLATAELPAAIVEGIEITNAAIAYLKDRSDVADSPIAAIGFSTGGLMTLWSAIEGADVDVVILMSPAALAQAHHKNLAAATSETNLERLTMPVLLTVGAADSPSIRKMAEQTMIPTLARLNADFIHKTDYPGNHKWFWRVQPEHFADLEAFLSEHLQ